MQFDAASAKRGRRIHHAVLVLAAAKDDTNVHIPGLSNLERFADGTFLPSFGGAPPSNQLGQHRRGRWQSSQTWQSDDLWMVQEGPFQRRRRRSKRGMRVLGLFWQREIVYLTQLRD
jgi:hypothetical protein